MARHHSLVLVVLLLAAAWSGCLLPGNPPPHGPPGPPPMEWPQTTPSPQPFSFPALPPLDEHALFGRDGRGADDPGAKLPAGLWAGAAASHPFAALVESPRLLVAGALAVEDPGELRIQPRVDSALPAMAPTELVFRGAQVGGETGTLVVLVSTGVTLAGWEAGGSRNVSALLARAGEILAAVPTDPSLFHFNAGPQTPLPASYDAMVLTRLAIDLPANFTVAGTAMRFIDAAGDAHALDPGVQVAAAEAVYHTGGSFLDSALHLSFRAPLGVLPQGDIHLQATRSRGTLTVAGATHALPEVPVAVSVRAAAPFVLEQDGVLFIARPAGDAFDVYVGGHPRLGASVAAAPNLIELAAEPGQVVAFQVLLIEGSLGARAHLGGYRVEADDELDLRLKATEPFQLTNAMLAWLNETADFTSEHPIAAIVTVPAMLAVVVFLPFVALAEAFTAIATAFFGGPSLTGTIEPGEGTAATFEVEVPAVATEAVLHIQGRNFPDQSVRLVITPLEPPAET